VFVDAVTGARLGVFDVSKGPIDDVVIKSPESGALALILGEAVLDEPIEEGYVVPVGTTLVNAVEPNQAGELVFDRISRATERLNLVIEGPSARDARLYVAGQVCDGKVSTHCTVELAPDAGKHEVRWGVDGSYTTLDRWGGACVGGQWSKCWIDPAHGEKTVTARFAGWSPPY